ncbi:hypothetical protein ACIQCM_03080 [Pseudarthrobacter sp. NPDC092439]|uniref:sunset domain-containing protein n=1 Tax=unclassified Pseudarthrobacter TaxID=2647000 RepID=UPI003819FEEA
MDIVLWIILIAVAVAVVWWLLNRSSSSPARPGHDDAPAAHADGALSRGGAAPSAEAAATTGLPGAAGFGVPAEPVAPTTAEEPANAATGGGRPGSEWETQWSEGSAPGATGDTPGARTGTVPAPGGEPTHTAAPVHHAEYTDRHAPTLPGAESAALEEDARDGAGHHHAVADVPDGAAAAETMDRTQSSALVETGTDRIQDEPGNAAQPEPAGHLAADEPYGAGSVAASTDGTGPAGYPVKGVATDMVYYDEDHPAYGEARAEVWFESAAHAEAAGFRAPRRQRL